MFEHRLFADRILTFEREIKTRVSHKLSQRNILSRVVMDSFDFGRATLRLISHPYRRNKNGLVIKCRNVSTYGSLSRIIVPTIPWSHFSLVIDTKRRTKLICQRLHDQEAAIRTVLASSSFRALDCTPCLAKSERLA